jgi:hypothetical protein
MAARHSKRQVEYLPFPVRNNNKTPAQRHRNAVHQRKYFEGVELRRMPTGKQEYDCGDDAALEKNLGDDFPCG